MQPTGLTALTLGIFVFIQLHADSIGTGDREPHRHVVTQVRPAFDARGTPAGLVTNRYVEIADGLNRQDDSGRWIRAEAVFEEAKGWAVANRCQHTVAIALDLRRTGGVILTQPDGTRLRSHVVGLSYFDSASGRSVLLAETRSCRGQIVAPSQVLFSNAFDDVDADIRYTIALNGLEQDVILRAEPPAPEEFGLDPSTTKLEVLTEFIDAPTPRISPRILRRPNIPRAQPFAEPEQVDETLDFGPMRVGPGRVFVTGDESETVAPVGKRWTRMNQRQFLIEAVSYEQVRPSLRALNHDGAGAGFGPPAAGKPRRKGLVQTASGPDQRPITERRPDAESASTASAPSQVAAARGPGVVIDYLFTLNAAQNPGRFRSDTTYYISGPASFSGVVFEGGAVLKYAVGASLSVDSFITDETAMHRPVIFTAFSDDSVGDPVALGAATFPRPTPLGYFGSPCLQVRGADSGSASPMVLNASNLRFAHAVTGLRVQGGTGHLLRNSQFRDCQVAFDLQALSLNPPSASLCNVLIARCGTAITANGTATALSGQHMTIADTTTLRGGSGTPLVEFRNSLLAGVASVTGATTDASLGNAIVATSSGTFTPTGAGGYYLPRTSPHLRACSSNSLNAGLISDLAQRTTEAPALFSGTVTRDLVLAPTARLDSTPTTLDRGYHYPPIDHLVSGVRIEGANLQISDRTTVAAYGPVGFLLGAGGRITADGRAARPVRLIRAVFAQEQPTGMPAASWIRSPLEFLVDCDTNATPASQFTASYTEIATPAGTGGLLHGRSRMGRLALAHSQLYGGTVTVSPGGDAARIISLVNCLVQGANFTAASGTNPLTASLVNCTFREARIELQPTSTDSWELLDTLFTDAELLRPLAGFNEGFNAYHRATNITATGTRVLITSTNLPGANASAVSALAFFPGPLGFVYHNAAALRDRGSRTADLAGLYHQTTSPAQTRELNSRVDIGFHFPVISNGAALDSDADGIADLDEDRDGNGVLSPANSSNLLASQETAFDRPDTDGDGYSDGEERRRGSDPRRADAPRENQLVRWRFNDSSLASEQGDLPVVGSSALPDPFTWEISAANLEFTPGSSGTPAQNRWLGYNWTRPDGSRLVSPTRGTVQFWFKPNWSSTTNVISEDGLTTARRLVAIQSNADESEYWALQLNPNGTTATFSVLRRNDTVPQSISWNVHFTRGNWTLVTLTYGAEGVSLWIDDRKLLPSGASFAPNSWPADFATPKRVWIGGGGNSAVTRTANGSFEGVATYAHILPDAAIVDEFQRTAAVDTDGDGLPDLVELRLPGFSPASRDSDGDGLPDKWEYDNFRGNSAQPNDDPDQDGTTNLDEYVQNRNPLIADARWEDSPLTQTVRNAFDLINIDFAGPARIVAEPANQVAFAGPYALPVVSSLDTIAEAPQPEADLWNVLKSTQLIQRWNSTQPISIRSASGGATPVSVGADFGWMLRWLTGNCSTQALDTTTFIGLPAHVDFVDGGILSGESAQPPWAPIWGECPHPMAPPIFGGPPVLRAPGTPIRGTPLSWWFGSTRFDFRPICGGDRGLLSAPIGVGVADGELTAPGNPGCSGSSQLVARPGFQASARFRNTTNDVDLRRVTAHPMFEDYLYTPEELSQWRTELRNRGYDLSDARSRLNLAGLSEGPWRIILYSATQNDERSCRITISTGSDPSPHFATRANADPTAGGAINLTQSTEAFIRPGNRRISQFLEGRHYVQAAADIRTDGMLTIEFTDHSAINGLQLIRLRPLEPVQWAQAIETNAAAGLILRWKQVPTANTYDVQRADSASGPWIRIASDLRQTSFRDPAVSQGRTYWYRVEARNERFTSTSDVASATAANLGSFNRPPTLSRIAPLGPAFAKDRFVISLAELQAKASASDLEGSVLTFRIERLWNGRLFFDGTEVDENTLASATTLPGATNATRFLIRNGTRVEWQSTDGAATMTPAFEVRAYDGNRFSDQTAPVPIEVRAANMVVWWGSSYHNAAGNGQVVDPAAEQARHGDLYYHLRSDADHWSIWPSPVSGPDSGRLINVVDLVGSWGNTVAVKGDGTVWSWGIGGPLSGVLPLQCPLATAACSLPWFNDQPIAQPTPIPFPPTAPRIRQVSLGIAHGVAVSSDGDVFLWGANQPIENGFSRFRSRVMDVIPTADLKSATLIGRYDPTDFTAASRASEYATLAAPTPVRVPAINGIIQVAASDHAVACLTSTGEVRDWGTMVYFDNRDFFFGPGGANQTKGGYRPILDTAAISPRPIPARVIQLVAGSEFFLVLTESGEVYAWGSNDSGGFGDPSWPFDVSDSTKVGTLTPRRVPGLSGIAQISASGRYAMALKTNGVVFHWGFPPTGVGKIETPRPLLDLPVITRIVATPDRAFAIDNHAITWGWGRNGNLGSTNAFASIAGLIQPLQRVDSFDTPVPVPDLEAATALSSPQQDVMHAVARYAPNAPRALTATTSNGRVDLRWKPLASVPAYRVYRSQSSDSGFVPIGVVAARGSELPSFTDLTVANGQSVFYRVAALHDSGESELSAPAWAQPASQPSPIPAFSVTAKSRSLRLEWCPAYGATEYRIFRAGPFASAPPNVPDSAYELKYRPDTSVLQASLAAPADCQQNRFAFLDADLQAGSWYAYRIIPSNASGPGQAADASQKVGTVSTGPIAPSITTIVQDNGSAVVTFQKNHVSTNSAWLIKLYHHNRVTTASLCDAQSDDAEPAIVDPGWVLDRTILLPELQGASAPGAALSVPEASTTRHLFLSQLPVGVWHRIVLVAQSENGLSTDSPSSPGNARVFRVTNPATTAPELMVANSGPGYIYLRYRHDAGFFPTTLSPLPLSCALTGQPSYDPTRCLSFTEWPWDSSTGETETWLLNLPSLAANQSYQVHIEPGASAGAGLSLDRTFSVSPRDDDAPFEVRPTTGDGRIRLDWYSESVRDNYPGWKFVVERITAPSPGSALPPACDPLTAWTFVKEGTEFRLDDRGLINGQPYQYRVIAIDPDTGRLAWTLTPPIQPHKSVPDADASAWLAGFSVSPRDSAVVIQWLPASRIDASNLSVRYTLEHSTDGFASREVLQTFELPVATNNARTQPFEFIHQPLSNGADHAYRLTIEIDGLDSLVTPSVSATPSALRPPLSPEDLTVRQITDALTSTRRYLLRWTPVPGARAYQIYIRHNTATPSLERLQVGQNHYEYRLPSGSIEPEPTFLVTAIGGSGAESRTISLASGGFGPATLFGSPSNLTARLDGDGAEYVQIIAPINADGTTATVIGPTNIMLRASAVFSAQSITRVEYYANDDFIGEATRPPYAFEWANPPVSQDPLGHRLVALAVTVDGRSRASAERRLKVILRPPLSEFTLQLEDLELKGSSFALNHSYSSSDSMDGILGRGWKFNFERAVLRRPNLASGWLVIGTGLGNIFAGIQDAPGTQHEISVTLPDGSYLRFAPTPSFAGNQAIAGSQWRLLADDSGNPSEENAGTIAMSFAAADGSEATLAAVGWSEHLGFDLRDTTSLGDASSSSIQLLDRGTPYAPNQFTVTMPDGSRYEFRNDGTGSADSELSLRLYRVVDAHGNYVKFATQRADRSEMVGATWSHVDVRRIAIQTFTKSDVLVREVWLDRVTGNSTAWLLYDPVAIQSAGTSVTPGSVSGYPIKRFFRNATRLEQIDDLIDRTTGGWRSSRFGYKTFSDTTGSGVAPQELLETAYDPNGVRILRNSYVVRNKLFVLATQENSRGTIRNLDYSTTQQVSSTVAPPGSPAIAESISYGPGGEIAESVDPTGVRESRVYDANGNITLAGIRTGGTNSQWLSTAALTYDYHGRPIAVTDALGNTTSVEFDPKSRPTAVQDANQQTTSYVYYETANADGSNPPGTLRSRVDASGNSVELTYNARGQVLSETRRLLNSTNAAITRYEYFDSPSTNGRIGDLRRIYSPAADVCRSISEPLPTALPLHATEYSYDENGNQRSQTITRTVRLVGASTNGTPAEVTRQERIVTETQYDPANRPIRSIRRRSLVDLGGNEIAGSAQVLEQTANAYGVDGKSTGSTDALGRATTQHYDASGNLIQTTYPDGTVTRNVFDALGRIILSQERARPSIPAAGTQPALGVTTAPASETVYDAAGRVTHSRKRINTTVSLLPDATYAGYTTNNPAQFVSQNTTPSTVWSTNAVAVWRKVYDATGRLKYSISPSGALTESVYDEAGRTVATLSYHQDTFPTDSGEIVTTGKQFLKTTLGYDGVGNNIWTLDAANQPAPGQPEDLTRRTEYVFDSLNRRIAARLPAVNGIRHETRSVYDSNGQRIAEIAEDGVIQAYRYSANGKLTAVFQDFNPQLPDEQQPLATRFEHDELGNLIAQTDAGGRRTRFEYDAQGRRTTRILPGGSLVSTNGSGLIERTDYLTAPESGSNTGRSILVKRVIDFGGRLAEYRHDINDQPALAIFTANAPNLGTTHHLRQYTDWGAVARVSEFNGDPATNTAVRVTEYAYNSTSRQLDFRNSPEGKLSYTFDPENRVKRILANYQSSFLVGTSYDYDRFGRLITVRELASSSDTNGTVIARHSYDANGNLATTSAGASLNTGYVYDSRNRLTRIQTRRGTTNTSPEIASFDYNASDRPLSPTGERLAVIESFSGLLANGNPVASSSRNRRVNYSYDRLRRLTLESIVSTPPSGTALLGYAGSAAYQFDKVGNRRSRTTSGALATALGSQPTLNYDQLDQIDNDSTAGTRSSWFDANGNTVSLATGTATATATGDQYDSLNRLVRRAASASKPEIGITYDADGRRIAKKVGSVETRYLVDDHNPTGHSQTVAELQPTQSSATLLRSYHYGLQRLCQQDSVSGTNRRYFVTDALGSTRMLADASGIPTHLFQYDAFGRLLTRLDWNATSSTWTTATTPTTGLPTTVLYAGEAWDTDLALSYNRARYYDPNLGRFWTRDTYEGSNEDPLTLHKYLYCHGAPISLVDPTGKSFILDFTFAAAKRGAIAGFTLGAVSTAFAKAKGATWGAALTHGLQVAAITELAFISPLAAWSFAGGSAATLGLGIYSGDVTADDIPEMLAFFAVGLVLHQTMPAKMDFARYSQTTYSPNFSPKGQKIYSEKFGIKIKNVDQLSDFIKSGKVNPQDLPVVTIVKDGNILLHNTRTAQALEKAGIPRKQWNVYDMTEHPTFEKLVAEQLERNSLTSSGTDKVIPQ